MFSLMIPHVNWPHPEELPPLHLPALNRLLRFGSFRSLPSAESEFCFGRLGVRLEGLYKEPYAFASPVWHQAGMNSVQIADASLLAVRQEEAEVLCHGLNGLYAGDGWRFAPLHPELWTVCLPKRPDWQAPCVLDVLGQADTDCCAQGGGRQEWLRRQTEIQMWLHSHPVNSGRQSAGLLPINGLWLWDTLPAPAAADADVPLLVGSDSPWAQYAAAVHTDAPYDWAAWLRLAEEHGTEPARTALYLDGLSAAVYAGDVAAYCGLLAEWDGRFFAPLWQALQGGSLPGLQIMTGGRGGGVLQVAAKPGWRFWRRSRVFAGSLG